MSKLTWVSPPRHIVWSRLRSLRLSLELTLTQVAAGANVPICTLSLLERGYFEATELMKKRLSEFYGVSIEDIFPPLMMGSRVYEPLHIGRTLPKVKVKPESEHE